MAMVALATLVLACLSVTPAITVHAKRTQAENLTLEIYNGHLNASGSFGVSERGHASLLVDRASAPMLVHCEVTTGSAAVFLVTESMLVEDTRQHEPTGLAFEIAVNEPSGMIEFAVTPAAEGQLAYSIRTRDRKPFALHSCTMQPLAESPAVANAGAATQNPHRITPSQAASQSGEFTLVEAQFVKWLRDSVVFDTHKTMTLEVGAGTPENVLVQCQVDLDLAEQTTFAIELVDKRTTISQRVEKDGVLAFTVWGGGRVKLGNPTQMWVWRSCELVEI
jgi:hypothetical protein